MEVCTKSRADAVHCKESDRLRRKYQDSFWYLNEGINLEERGKVAEAKLCYEKGLRLLEEGLRVAQNAEENGKPEAVQMKRKMERAKEQVKGRLVELQHPPAAKGKAPAIKPAFQDRCPEADWEDVTELLHVTEGVQLFHVDPNTGECFSTPPSELKVCQFMKDYKGLNVPPAFLLCGDWMFPLDPGISPVLKTNTNTYMFPDVEVLAEPKEDKACVGLLFAPPVDDVQIARFERILSCYSNYKDCSRLAKPQRPPPPFADQDSKVELSGSKPSDLSSNFQKGAKLISTGIEKGAVIGGKLLEMGAEKIKSSLTSNEEPTVVDPKVVANVQQVRTVTGAAMQVSGYLVSALSALTYQIGRHLAPIVREHGTKLLPDRLKKDSDEGSQLVDTVVDVAVAGLQAWAEIFLSLEEGGKILGKSLSNATVGLVRHKYGHDAAETTEEAMKAAGNTAMVYMNVKNLGVKAIAKRTAKDTAKNVLAIEQSERSTNGQ